MKLRSTALASGATALAAVAALALPGAAQAAQPGDLCRISASSLGPIFSILNGQPTGAVSYTIPAGGYVRIDGYGPVINNDTSYLAHGTGGSQGFLWRFTVDQSTCTS